MADVGEEVESEILVDKKLSEEKKNELVKELENYPCLWDTSKIDYKNKQSKATASEDLSQQFNITPNNLKRVLHSLRTGLVQEIRKEQDGQKSKWKYFETLAYMKEDVARGMKAKEESEWTDEETEQLIGFYKQNEQLWNHNLPSYRDRNLKQLNYKKLNEILPGHNQDDLKKQWHILKTIFYRELKREEGTKVSGMGTDSVYTSQWKFFKALMFVKGSDDVDPSVTTLGDIDVREYERPAKKIKADKARDMEEVKLELYKEAIKCFQTPLPVSVPVMDSTSNCNDEISLFVKSLESTLRRFSGRHLAIARKRINDVLFDMEMECYAREGLSTPGSSSQLTHLVSRYNLETAAPAFHTSNFNWPY